jgi:ribosome maturation factor RimP
MFKDTVKRLLEEGLEQRPDLFLIDFDVLSDNTIKVIIDGDNGVLKIIWIGRKPIFP